jgi:hypothetical protein
MTSCGFSFAPLRLCVRFDRFSRGQAAISAELAGIFERLGCSAQSWQARLEKPDGHRLLGRFFASSGATLREIRERLGVRQVVNLASCPAR